MRIPFPGLLAAMLSAILAGCGKPPETPREGPSVPAKSTGQGEAVKPVTSVEEALKLVEDYKGPASGFQLAVADSLQDPTGMNMAVITDRILAKGLEPDGFEQKDGYRVYRYKEAE